MKKILLIIPFVLFPLFTHASSLLMSGPEHGTVGEEILIELYIDPQGENVNALEGEIHIDPLLASIERIYNGNSSVLFWVEGPLINKENNTITFSGITPGGIQTKSKVFSYVLKLTSAGVINLRAEKATILKNDGKGTAVQVQTPSSPLTILGGNSNKKIVIEDKDVPEPFPLQIGTSNELYGGKYFLSFATQDKGVGIDHYEFASTWIFAPSPSDFTRTESPYLLSNKDVYKKLFIRATDKSGNIQLSTVSGPEHYKLLQVEAIIGVLLLCVLYFIIRFFL